VSDEVQALDALRTSVEALSTKIDKLETRTAHRIWAITAAVIVGGMVIVGMVVVGWLSAKQATCVRQYANQSAARTNVLSPASTARSDALDQLVRTLAPNPDANAEQRQEAFRSALVGYLKASDLYSKAAAQNPPPVAPAFRC
jgi:FtsZ-interacting cell division protein ZipA